jgi:hypothetical protein
LEISKWLHTINSNVEINEENVIMSISEFVPE